MLLRELEISSKFQLLHFNNKSSDSTIILYMSLVFVLLWGCSLLIPNWDRPSLVHLNSIHCFGKVCLKLNANCPKISTFQVLEIQFFSILLQILILPLNLTATCEHMHSCLQISSLAKWAFLDFPFWIHSYLSLRGLISTLSSCRVLIQSKSI